MLHNEPERNPKSALKEVRVRKVQSVLKISRCNLFQLWLIGLFVIVEHLYDLVSKRGVDLLYWLLDLDLVFAAVK